MKNNEKMTAILNTEFFKNNKDLGSVDEIYTAALAIDPTLDKEEFMEYLTMISVQMSDESDELSAESLVKVAGGIAWETVAGVIGVVTICYKGGEAIGKAIYYMTH